MGMPLIEGSDEFPPDQVRFADSETTVMLVIDVGFLNHLDGQSGDLMEAKLDSGVEPYLCRNLLGDPGSETVARDFIDLDIDRFVENCCSSAEARRTFD